MTQKKYTTPLIIFFTIVSLYIISIFTQDVEIFGIYLTEFNLFSDFTEIEDEDANLQIESENPGVLKAELLPAFSNLNSYSNSLLRKDNIDDLITYPSIEGNVDQLKYFFNALKIADTKTVRIAYMGDSIIEGDYITAEFRNRMQQKFGGTGLGYQALVSADSRFRLTSIHEFSDDWETYSLFGRNKKKDFALNGEVFVPVKGSGASYELRTEYNAGSTFNNFKILYEEDSNSKINITLDDAKKEDIQLGKTSGMGVITQKLPAASTKIELKFDPSKSTKLFGVFLDSDAGVQIDNYPYRGNTGKALSELSLESLKQMNNLMNYKLVLLQFGLNAVSLRKSKIKKLESELIEGINLLKKAFPETSFIIIGVSDKSRKKGSSFVTDPVIYDLIDMQKRIAKETNIAFWNTFEAMGGKNSMVKWVKSKPAFAHSDFTHFNKNGADKIGEILSKVLIDEYTKHSN